MKERDNSRMLSRGKQPQSPGRNMVLSGNKLPSLTSNETFTRVSSGTESVKSRSALPDSRKQTSRNTTDLTLQVYSHMKIQRKFEEDRNSKISRTERKRQKVKRELCRSTMPSRDDFAPRWIYHRGAYGPLGQRQNGDSNPDSGSAEGRTGTPDYEGRQSMSPLRDVSKHSDEDIHASSVTADQNFEANSSMKKSSSTQTPRSTHRSAGGVFHSAHSPGGYTYHTIKGPGRIHIKFSSRATSDNRSSNKSVQRKTGYQWDCMPAGCVVPSHVAQVQIDGNLL